MSDWIDRRTRIWAIVAILVGVGFFLALEIAEEPEMSAVAIAVEFVKILPVVLVSVGVLLLFKVTTKQRRSSSRSCAISKSPDSRVNGGAPNRDRC